MAFSILPFCPVELKIAPVGSLCMTEQPLLHHWQRPFQHQLVSSAVPSNQQVHHVKLSNLPDRITISPIYIVKTKYDIPKQIL